MDFTFFVFGVSNLIPQAGATPIAPNQTGGDAQVGDSFVIGNQSGQTITVTDTVDGDFEDGTTQPQTLADPITIDGRTFPVGTQVQNEFILETDIGVDIIVIRFDPGNGRITNAYTTTDPIPPGTTVTITGTRDGVAGSTPYADLICFVTGTRIRTPAGEIPVERLAVGDHVTTLDGGPDTVRWVGRRQVAGIGAFAPVVIAAGALGNARALAVSPQHRILLSGWRAQLYFGQDEVLVAAKHLVDGVTIRRQPRAVVTYHHFVFGTHQIVWSEGIATESFDPGHVGLAGLDTGARAEIVALFPQLAENPMAALCPARPAARAFEGRLLADD